jgi:hypothetical protein
MSAILYNEEYLHQVFARRLQLFDDMYNRSATEDEKSITRQKMVRYVLFNYLSYDVFAAEIENYISQIGNDPTRYTVVFYLVTDILSKAQQIPGLAERYKPIVKEIVFKIAGSKKKNDIEKTKEELKRFVKRNIYQQPFINELIDGINRRAMKNSKDILLAGNIFLGMTNELTSIKKKRAELGEDPKRAEEIKAALQQEVCQRDKFIEFHTHQMSEIGSLLSDVNNEYSALNAKAREKEIILLDSLMGAGLDDDDEEEDEEDED